MTCGDTKLLRVHFSPGSSYGRSLRVSRPTRARSAVRHAASDAAHVFRVAAVLSPGGAIVSHEQPTPPRNGAMRQSWMRSIRAWSATKDGAAQSRLSDTWCTLCAVIEPSLSVTSVMLGLEPPIWRQQSRKHVNQHETSSSVMKTS